MSGEQDDFSQAEGALAALADRYLAWAQADVARLGAGVARLREGSRDGLSELFDIAHDVKGQGTTFGYPLVTEIANRLCRLIEGCGDPDAATLAALAAHVAALAEILALRLQGDGGDRGRRLLGRLEA
jgi:chemotaxis protein histidine kinase CheA